MGLNRPNSVTDITLEASRKTLMSSLCKDPVCGRPTRFRHDFSPGAAAAPDPLDSARRRASGKPLAKLAKPRQKRVGHARLEGLEVFLDLVEFPEPFAAIDRKQRFQVGVGRKPLG